jgi:hypothetical protein
MNPAAPDGKILTPNAGPRMTLPGPTLPPELSRLKDAGLVSVIDAPERSAGFRLPSWLVSGLVMLAVIVPAVALMFYFFPVVHGNAETKTPADTVQAASNTTAGSHPLAQYIEVTGFRIVVDFNKKSEIHYLIVNHSAADLSDVTVFVTLRTANAKPGQPPLSRFSFRTPSLGPFESKEMTSSIEKLSRSVTLPDWQDVRADVQISQ